MMKSVNSDIKKNFVNERKFVCFFYREKDEDEGIPSETEEDKKLLEIKTKEMRGEQNTPIIYIYICVDL